MAISFEDPPSARAGGNGEVRRDLEELRASPGRWARVAEYPKPRTASSMAQCIRQGRGFGVNAGEFDAKSRTMAGVGVVFARYVGGKAE